MKARWAPTAFSGEGARLGGGRWNSPGVPLVYLAGTLELAELEVLVDLPSPRVLGAYVASRVGVPDRLVEQLDPTALPPNWRRDPAPRSVRATGG